MKATREQCLEMAKKAGFHEVELTQVLPSVVALVHAEQQFERNKLKEQGWKSPKDWTLADHYNCE
jgi:hypothetical protein